MTPLALTLGITDAEVNALAIAARRIYGGTLSADNLPVLHGLLTLLRRFASESNGGIVGMVLAEIAATCAHTDAHFEPFLVQSSPGAWSETPWCPLCGRYVIG